MRSSATSQGSVSLAPWTVPNGSSLAVNDRFELHFEYRFWTDTPRPIMDWAVLIFDRFESGPEAGKWRPAYAFGTAQTHNYEGTITMTRVPGPPPLESARDRLSNRSTFDGKQLWIMVLAKSGAATDFLFALDVRRDAMEGDRLSSPPAAAAAMPAKLVQGAAVSWFAQGSTAEGSYMIHTPDVQVRRTIGNAAADSLLVESRHDSARGWVYANAAFDVAARGGHYEFEAEYRGRAMRSGGTGPESAASPESGLSGWSHYVYRSGEGPTSMRLRLDYASAPVQDEIQFFRFDVDTPLEELLDGPVFEQWRIRGADRS